MRAKHQNRQSNRQLNRQLIGIFLAATGAIIGFVSYLMGIVPMIAFGLASFLIGVMAFYLPEPKSSYAERLASYAGLPSLLNIERLLEDLDLDERGIYIPTVGIGVCPKVLVPLAETPATKSPPLGLMSSRRIFVTVGKNPEDRGVLLDAPGSEILVAIEHALHLDIAKIPLDDLAASLNSGFEALGLAKVTRIERQDTELTVEVWLETLVEMEKNLRNQAPRLVAQVGTPILSALAAAVSKSTARYVTLRNSVLKEADKKMSMKLKLDT